MFFVIQINQPFKGPSHVLPIKPLGMVCILKEWHLLQ